MSAANRSRALANELARRAIAAAERRREAELAGDDVAERLRAAAGDDGKLTPEEAVEALSGNGTAPVNPLAAEYSARQAARQERTHRRLFGSEPEAEAPRTPEGDVDAGKGDGGEQRYEHVGGEVMEVLDLDQVMDPKRRS